jgi:hypothetical protein
MEVRGTWARDNEGRDQLISEVAHPRELATLTAQELVARATMVAGCPDLTIPEAQDARLIGWRPRGASRDRHGRRGAHRSPGPPARMQAAPPITAQAAAAARNSNLMASVAAGPLPNAPPWVAWDGMSGS